MTKLFKTVLTMVALVAGFAGTCKADPFYDPSGPQNNVSLSSVLAGGWSIIYQGGYGNFVGGGAFAGADQYLMLASMENGTGVLSLLAEAKTSDVLQVTGVNQTHLANGTYWYNNGSSMGFTPTSAISQNSADTQNAPGFGYNGFDDGSQRLSWHGGSSNINGGWRTGNTTFLNSEPTGWTRLILTSNGSAGSVPEPSTLALLGLGGIGLAVNMIRRRRLQKSAA